jgi:hypothetical protein
MDFSGATDWTITIVCSIPARGDDTQPLTVAFGTDGFFTQNSSNSGGYWFLFINGGSTFAFAGPNATGVHVITFGGDSTSSGSILIGYDGVAGSPATDINILTPTVGPILGNTHFPFSGNIYEMCASTDRCTSATITSIYNSVVANGAHT